MNGSDRDYTEVVGVVRHPLLYFDPTNTAIAPDNRQHRK